MRFTIRKRVRVRTPYNSLHSHHKMVTEYKQNITLNVILMQQAKLLDVLPPPPPTATVTCHEYCLHTVSSQLILCWAILCTRGARSSQGDARAK